MFYVRLYRAHWVYACLLLIELARRNFQASLLIQWLRYRLGCRVSGVESGGQNVDDLAGYRAGGVLGGNLVLETVPAIVAEAVAVGAVAGLSDSAKQAVTDAYAKLKALVSGPRVWNQ
ncbi:hypothetical protein [Nocardia sp. NPDC019255]|uniref:hypothetical protein n=1 Tax=Nocardia sp. NPDC019255 TaxID=3154591 RepID=UPI0033EE3D2C